MRLTRRRCKKEITMQDEKTTMTVTEGIFSVRAMALLRPWIAVMRRWLGPAAGSRARLRWMSHSAKRRRRVRMGTRRGARAWARRVAGRRRDWRLTTRWWFCGAAALASPGQLW
jgi:hypothetical protein